MAKLALVVGLHLIALVSSAVSERESELEALEKQQLIDLGEGISKRESSESSKESGTLGNQKFKRIQSMLRELVLEANEKKKLEELGEGTSTKGKGKVSDAVAPPDAGNQPSGGSDKSNGKQTDDDSPVSKFVYNLLQENEKEGGFTEPGSPSTIQNSKRKEEELEENEMKKLIELGEGKSKSLTSSKSASQKHGGKDFPVYSTENVYKLLGKDVSQSGDNDGDKPTGKDKVESVDHKKESTARVIEALKRLMSE